MNQSPAARDLAKKLQVELGELVERNIRVAQVVLEPAELSILLIEASVSMILTTAATVAASVGDEAIVGEMFDQTIVAITGFATGDRERSLAQVARRRGAGGR